MRGFASMGPERLREVCSRGGKTTWARGTAHKWTAGEEAQQAARRGAAARKAKRAQKMLLLEKEN